MPHRQLCCYQWESSNCALWFLLHARKINSTQIKGNGNWLRTVTFTVHACTPSGFIFRPELGYTWLGWHSYTPILISCLVIPYFCSAQDWGTSWFVDILKFNSVWNWGKFGLVDIVIPPLCYLNTLQPDSVSPDNLPFLWLLSQFNGVKKKAEYNRLQMELNMFPVLDVIEIGRASYLVC